MDKEVLKFDENAHKWWDQEGDFKTLHKINNIRFEFIKDLLKEQNFNLNQTKKVLDIGCGGGILSESLAELDCKIYGIDASKSLIQIAKNHAESSNLDIDYQNISIENFGEIKENQGQFDIITCMELLEHVEDFKSVLKQTFSLLKKGGICFFSTLNRNLKSYILAIFMAEYVLKLLPKGIHHYKKFIKPSEIVQEAKNFNAQAIKIKGISFNPITYSFFITKDPLVNYIFAFKKL